MLSLSLLFNVAASWAATFQAPINNISSELVKDRITQLERISNAHSQLLTQLQQQLFDNQCDIDSLRGQTQENEYRLSQVVERQKEIYKQIDNLSIQSPTVFKDGQFQTSMSTDVIKQGTAPISDKSTAGNGDVNIDYNEAVALVIEKKQNDQAISLFRNFIKRYPDSIYQPNANYWLGQINYNQGKKDDALYYFALVAKKYPKSPKAPDAFLKVGVIMQEKGQKDKAQAVYHQVGKLYPNTEAAKQAKKRLVRL